MQIQRDVMIVLLHLIKFNSLLGFDSCHVRTDRVTTDESRPRILSNTHTHTHTRFHIVLLEPESCSNCAAGCLHGLSDFLQLFFTSFMSWSQCCVDAKQRNETLDVLTSAQKFGFCLLNLMEPVKSFRLAALSAHLLWWKWRTRKSVVKKYLSTRTEVLHLSTF